MITLNCLINIKCKKTCFELRNETYISSFIILLIVLICGYFKDKVNLYSHVDGISKKSNGITKFYYANINLKY